MFLGPPEVSTLNRISNNAVAFAWRKRVDKEADKLSDTLRYRIIVRNSPHLMHSMQAEKQKSDR